MKSIFACRQAHPYLKSMIDKITSNSLHPKQYNKKQKPQEKHTADKPHVKTIRESFSNSFDPVLTMLFRKECMDIDSGNKAESVLHVVCDHLVVTQTKLQAPPVPFTSHSSWYQVHSNQKIKDIDIRGFIENGRMINITEQLHTIAQMKTG